MFIAMLGVCQCTEGQITLDSVLIKDSSYYQLHGKENKAISKTAFSNSVYGFLQSISSGQVQMSTPGGLTTFLHRGMGNRHMPILWEGVNLQSTLNGSSDLSLIPSRIFDGTRFFTAGNLALIGNNGMSGTIELGRLNMISPLNISIGVSTLQNYSFTLLTAMNTKKYKSSVGVEAAMDKNLFYYKFQNRNNQRAATDFKKINFVYHGNYLPGKNQSLSFDLWLQQAGRIIPMSITAAPVLQAQNDANLRLKFGHAVYFRSSVLKTSMAYLHEKINFTAPGIDSKSKLYIYNGKLEYYDHKQSYYSSIIWRSDVAVANFYNDVKKRGTAQLKFSKNVSRGNYFSQYAIRQDLVNGEWMPVSLTIVQKYKVLQLQVNRNYTLPGFNDLFWPTGGNTQLKVEKSWMGELKAEMQLGTFNLNCSVYGNHVRNWIQWVPQATGLWEAINQKTVFSRGMDIQIGRQFNRNQWHFTSEIQYSYNQTHALSHYTNVNLIGKQLIYIPGHKLNGTIQSRYRNHQWQLSYFYTGKRFDTPDHSHALPRIHLVNAAYSYQCSPFKYSLLLQNVLNTSYNLINFFPMPGIQAEIQCTYQINPKY